MQSLQDLADRTCSGLAEMHEQLINNVSFNGDDGRYDPFAVYEREICRCEAIVNEIHGGEAQKCTFFFSCIHKRFLGLLCIIVCF